MKKPILSGLAGILAMLLVQSPYDLQAMDNYLEYAPYRMGLLQQRSKKSSHALNKTKRAFGW